MPGFKIILNVNSTGAPSAKIFMGPPVARLGYLPAPGPGPVWFVRVGVVEAPETGGGEFEADAGKPAEPPGGLSDAASA
jgi:hypothetical protein